jgi:hypothetical protein
MSNVTNLNDTFAHWSDQFGIGIRASIGGIEICEWNFLLMTIFGMHQGVEIGHPGITKKIFLVIYLTGYLILANGMLFFMSKVEGTFCLRQSQA